jgi:hypothetical protein
MSLTPGTRSGPYEVATLIVLVQNWLEELKRLAPVK